MESITSYKWNTLVTPNPETETLEIACAADQEAVQISPVPRNLVHLTVTGRNVRNLEIDLSGATEHLTVVLDHCGFREIPEGLIHPLVDLSISHNPLWFHEEISFYTMSKKYMARAPHPLYLKMLFSLGYHNPIDFFYTSNMYVYNGILTTNVPNDVRDAKRFAGMGYAKYASQSFLPVEVDRLWNNNDFAFFERHVQDDADRAHLANKRREREAYDIEIRRVEEEERLAEILRQERQLLDNLARDADIEAARAQRVIEITRLEPDQAVARQAIQRVYTNGNFANNSQNVHNSSVNKGAKAAMGFLRGRFTPSRTATAFLKKEVPETKRFWESTSRVVTLDATLNEVAEYVSAAVYASEYRDEICEVMREELHEKVCSHGEGVKLISMLGGFYEEIEIGRSAKEEFRDRFAAQFKRLEFPKRRLDEDCAEILVKNQESLVFSREALFATMNGNVYGGYIRFLAEATEKLPGLSREIAFAKAVAGIYDLRKTYEGEIEPAIINPYFDAVREALDFEWPVDDGEKSSFFVERVFAYWPVNAKPTAKSATDLAIGDVLILEEFLRLGRIDLGDEQTRVSYFQSISKFIFG